jgi:NADH-quinone oxidoreductase subunit K
MLLRLLTILLPLNIFILGLFGVVLWRKNLISMLISLEIMFVAANVGFILASLVIDDAAGFVFSIMILTLAGIEVAVGLALIILIYRRYGNIYLQSVAKLKS